MKLKSEFEIVTIGDETMAVPVGDGASELHCVVKMNGSAAEILDMLKDDISKAEIVDRLADKYSNDKAELELFVGNVLKELNDNGLLNGNV